MDDNRQTIAYFSMEIAVDASIPTYSGGLGVLAGDTLRSAADLEVSMVAVTLLHRKGYFRQILEPNGHQREIADEWYQSQNLEQITSTACISLEGRKVAIRAWRYQVRGISGHTVPVYFLDTDLPENDALDRGLTDYLYGGDQHYRLCQEAVLGLGGLEILEVLEHRDVHTYHLNEGHSALLALGLLERQFRTQPGASPIRRTCPV
jgi:starch phosphorylase